jgi:hypothetical protein
MLVLDRRPEEPSARQMFLRVRASAHAQIAAMIARIAPDANREVVDLLTTYAIAAADGLFIAKEIGGDSVDLLRLFELHARAVYDILGRLTAPGGTPEQDSP